MDKEQVIKEIVFVGTHWNGKREKAEPKLNNLLAEFPTCSQCANDSEDIFFVVEEIKSGFLVKKTETSVFRVCSLKCFFDRGLNPKAYYSVVVKLASGEVFSTGFVGPNAVAINEFVNKIKEPV